MSFRINYHQEHLLRDFNQASDAIQQSLDKLASGERVRSGADDPSGLLIAHDLMRQIRGLSVVNRDINDALNTMQVADYATSSQRLLLLQMHDVASQAVAETDTTILGRLHQEFMDLQDEVNQIATTAHQRPFHLLDGTFQDVYYQLDTQPYDGVRVTLASSESAAIGYEYKTVTNGSSIAIEGSDYLNNRITGVGKDLRQLELITEAGSFAVDMEYNLSASVLEQRINAIDGIHNVKVTQREGTGLQSISESIVFPEVDYQEMLLNLSLRNRIESTQEQGVLVYKFTDPTGGVSPLEVRVAANAYGSTSMEVNQFYQEIKNEFRSSATQLANFGLEAHVFNDGDVLFRHDPNVLSTAPTVTVEYENNTASSPTNTSGTSGIEKFAFRIRDGQSEFSLGLNRTYPSGVPAAVSFNNWQQAGTKIALEELSPLIGSYSAPSTGETGRLIFAGQIGDDVSTRQELVMNISDSYSDFTSYGTHFGINIHRNLGNFSSLGITATSAAHGGELVMIYDNSLEVAPKITMRYENVTSAPGGNTFGISYMSYFQNHVFQVVNGVDVSDQFVSRPVAEAFIPAVFDIDFTDMEVDNRIQQLALEQTENDVLFNFALSSATTFDALQPASTATQASAAEAIQVVEGAIRDIKDIQGILQAAQSTMEYSTLFNLEKQTHLQDGHDQIMNVNVASELVNYARNRLVQNTSLSMLTQGNALSDIVAMLLKT
jgi:flagellin-like hook-associated protein FlgL